MRTTKELTSEEMVRRILRVAVLLIEKQQEEASPQEVSAQGWDASEKHESFESM